MDEVAALAAVSKATVYKQFADKERLFSEIVRSAVMRRAIPTRRTSCGSPQSHLDADLRELARRQLRRVMQPQILQLRRLVIGEAARFPELGRFFYERGPSRTLDALATSFAALAERGLLTIDQPEIAAAHFNWLVMSIPLNRAMLSGEGPEPARRTPTLCRRRRRGFPPRIRDAG